MTKAAPIASMIFLLQETIAYARQQSCLDESQLNFLEDFRSARLVPIFKREKLAARKPFTLCLIGLTNVGKSTLIEALLGAPIAPKKNGPATAVPVEYSFAPKWRLEVRHHLAGDLPVVLDFEEAQQMSEALSERVIDLSETEAQKIALVCVKGPIKLLERNLILADTPGIDAAKIEGERVADSVPSSLSRFLQSAGRAYLCVAAGVNWKVSPEEVEFYRSMSHLCSNIIVTKWEDTDAEKAEWKSTFERLFPGADFEFVNARRSNNVERIQEIIGAQSSTERRLLQVRRELLKAWKDLVSHFSIVFHTPVPWMQDSLVRFHAACSPYAELHPITSELKDHGRQS
jgi:hypothetical protein